MVVPDKQGLPQPFSRDREAKAAADDGVCHNQASIRPSSPLVVALNRQAVARLGESLACEFLAGEGYSLRARNWRCPGGEIDIVAEKPGTLAIVEVKTRRSEAYGSGEDAVTARKLASLERCALAYLEAQGWMDRAWQVDVIAIDLDRRGRMTRLEHLQDVLQR